MARVKVFRAISGTLNDAVSPVEAEVNDWLAKNDGRVAQVSITTNFSQGTAIRSGVASELFSYVITVFYEELIPLSSASLKNTAVIAQGRLS